MCQKKMPKSNCVVELKTINAKRNAVKPKILLVKTLTIRLNEVWITF